MAGSAYRDVCSAKNMVDLLLMLVKEWFCFSTTFVDADCMMVRDTVGPYGEQFAGEPIPMRGQISAEG